MTTERTAAGQWKPGTSGNPAGKKPGTISFMRIFREKLQEIPKGETEILAVLMVRKYLDNMSDGLNAGDPAAGVAFRDLIDRIDGKATANVQFGSALDAEWIELFVDLYRGVKEENIRDIDDGRIIEVNFGATG